MSKKKKTLLGIVVSLVFAIALGFTIYLNVERSKYTVLFPNITQEESQQIYASLQEMSISPRMSEKGEVMVRNEEWDRLVFELAGKGYPQTAPAYGIFLENTGFTRTEFEKKQVLIFQLQNRIQETLSRIEGIKSSVVTINIPEDSTLVFDENRQSSSTSSVMVKMEPNVKLSPERVSAIRNLVAFSVPKMPAENVRVIDGNTGVEIEPNNGAAGGYDTQRLEFERQIEQDIVNKVKTILSPKYGPDGVTAIATVKIDYSKMKTEQKDLVTKDDGSGMTTRDEERYSLSGNVPAAGLVGEENNTDVPQYNTGDGTSGGMTDYERIRDYDYGHLITQIEKSQGDIVEKSVSVLVNDPALDTQTRDALIDLVAKGTNIDPTYISITNLDLGKPLEEPEPGEEEEVKPLISRELLYILIAAAVLLLILIITIAVLVSKHRKKVRRRLEEAALQEAMLKEAELMNKQKEIEAHKRALTQSAKDASNTKESAITEEIKHFTEENPEIAASLIRSWLKEDE